MGTGQLLTVLGKTGEGLAGGMTEAIKYEIMKRRDEALFQREKTLEEYRHGKRTEEEEKQYGRRTTEEEKKYQRRREEEGVEYKGRREKEQAEYESRLSAKGKEPSEEQKKYEFYVNTFGKEEALKLIRGKSDKFDKAQLDTLKYAADLVLEGKSAEEVNAVLKAAGMEERYVEYATGEKEDIEGTGFWGFGKKQRDVKELRLEAGKKQTGLLGGVSSEAISTDDSLRADSTKKGKGYFGELDAARGKTSTEISIGVNIDGKEMEIPTLVPTLSEDEKQHLLSGKKPTEAIVQKAVEHARQRISEGKSPFAGTEKTQTAQDGQEPESEFERLSRIVGGKEAPVKPTGGILEKKPSETTGKDIPYKSRFIGGDPEKQKAEKEAGKQELIALANKMGVGKENWKDFWNLIKNIAGGLWGSYDEMVGDMIKTQTETRKTLGK